MHGRLKVKTTAEQQEEKRIEREKKAKAFTQGMKQIFQNRGCEDKEQETLKLTEKLLSANPDVYTLWNIRKEIFTNMKEREDENLCQLLCDELKFLQSCLMVNPKSYGVWSQRQFVMLTMKTPDWLEELNLCNLFLKYDERNFHCWDHRRFVVRESKVPAQEELDFTTRKITDNFSNYSAWHNRTKLLPLVHPDEKNPGRIDEATLLKEFNLAQNAFFTDPNDQSAWFYQRWLLGRGDAQPRLLSLSLHRKPSCTTVVASFSHPVKLSVSSTATVNGSEVEGEWKSCEEVTKGLSLTHSCVWIFDLSEHTKTTENDEEQQQLEVMFKFPDVPTCPASLQLKLDKGTRCSHLRWTVDRLCTDDGEEKMFSENHTVTKSSFLEGELESLKMLLEEEPDNKWTMLTMVYLMRSLDGIKYVDETEQLLHQLIQIDFKRKGYYTDLRSKYRIEDKLQQLSTDKGCLEEVDLSGLELTTLYHGQYLTSCRTVNLSNNPQLNTNNLVEKLCGVQELILTNNSVDVEDLKHLQRTLPLDIKIVPSSVK